MLFTSAVVAALSLAGTSLAAPTPAPELIEVDLAGNNTLQARGYPIKSSKAALCLVRTKGWGNEERCLGWKDNHLILTDYEGASKYNFRESKWAWGYNGDRSHAWTTGAKDINGWEIWMAPYNQPWMSQDWTIRMAVHGDTEPWSIVPWVHKDSKGIVYAVDVRNGDLTLGSRLQMWQHNYGHPNQAWYPKYQK